jgi:hypothetical protein
VTDQQTLKKNLLISSYFYVKNQTLITNIYFVKKIILLSISLRRYKHFTKNIYFKVLRIIRHLLTLLVWAIIACNNNRKLTKLTKFGPKINFSA